VTDPTAPSNSPSATPRGGFARVSPQVDLPQLDSEVLQRWDDLDAFAHSVSRRAGSPEYTFYDGPPFATGSPHYGHILQGAIKDIVPRYWTMRGYRIERRFGWDTHGLPVEIEVERELGVSGPRQIQELGIAAFNEACRSMVNTTTDEWEVITRRIGRWVDFEDDYKTMDPDYMESVWWVFRSLWDKGLIYQDFKVLPYSWGAATPLSNFEANLNYKDIDDPSITVRLEVLEDHGPLRAGDFLIVWTTTPWTLPANLAVAVGADIDYVRIDAPLDGHDGSYWLADSLVRTYFEGATPAAHAVGTDLIGAGYRPPFDYFGEERDRGAFRVLLSDDVNTAEGTGLVHMAPAYGEADFFALQAAGLDVLVDPVDAEARFTAEVTDVSGQYVKDADAQLIRMLKDAGKLVRHTRITHSYPFCWRTDTPLIYKAIPTWFVAVESFRDRMVELNKKVRWVPEAVGARRFANWLGNARDWAISRNRYWGSCIPVWECDSCEERVCVGSRAELESLSGVWVDDLHKHIVDNVYFPCSVCAGTMVRIPEVLDCWFESGAMPYAQIHYPFENEARFAERNPADFIAEGLDQTRGWFYTLVILGTALMDEIPFENCIVTGMILAEDGRKMSKSLKNYPDPGIVLDEFGADALRAYLINSPVVRADPLRFRERGVREVVRTVLLPLWNALSFFTTYAEADSITLGDIKKAPPIGERDEIDRWIVSMLQTLIADVNREMEQYRLYAVIPPVLGFIDDLTNWYIRRSRRRFWAHREQSTESDKLSAFATLYEVLMTFTKVAAPVLPFISDRIYSILAADDPDALDTVHYEDYPRADTTLIDEQLETSMETVRSVVGIGRALRKRNGLPVRQPLASLTVVTRAAMPARAVREHMDLIRDELNVVEVGVEEDERELVHLSAKANFKSLGPRFGPRTKEIAAAVAELSHDQVASLLETGEVEVAGERLEAEDVAIIRAPREEIVVASEGPITIVLDCAITPELAMEGLAREVVNRIQGLRRSSGFAVTDRIRLRYATDSDELAAAIEAYEPLIREETLAAVIVRNGETDGTVLDVAGHVATVAIERVAETP